MDAMVDDTVKEARAHDGGNDDENEVYADTRMTSAKSETDGYQNRNRRLPIDRGWAWVVLVACFIELFVIIGYFKCFGIFFVQLQRRFRSSSAATSVIFSLQNAFYSISALFVMNLGQDYSSRFFVVVGGIVVTLSFVITGFVKDLRLAYFSAGIMSGTCLGCIQPHISTILNTYFEKRRGLANNLAGSGVSVGALSLAPLYTSAFIYYGFTGTHFIVAGITLQVVVIGCLLRPIEFYQNKGKNGIESPEVDLRLLNKRRSTSGDSMPYVSSKALTRDVSLKNDNESQPNRSSEGVTLLGRGQDLLDMHTQANGCNVEAKECILSEAESSSSCLNENKQIERSCLARDEYSAFASGRNGNEQTNNIKTTRLDKQSNISSNPFLKFFIRIKEQLINNRLLKKRVFLFFLLCNAFLNAGCVIVEGFIAPHAVDVNIDNQRVAILISVIAISDICSKFFIGYLSDSKWIKRTTIVALAAIVLGVCAFFVYFLNTFATVMAFCVVMGCLQPVYFVLHPVIAVDILSLKELKSALGFIAVTQGISTSMLFPVAGYLRDTTGGYHASFAFSGCLLLIGGTLCYFLPNFKAFGDRRKTKTVAKNDGNSDNVKPQHHNKSK